MWEGHFRRLPVIQGNTLVGIVTDRDLKKAMPSDASALSIGEINYLIARLTVGEIMTKHPVTVADTLPLQAAGDARGQAGRDHRCHRCAASLPPPRGRVAG